MKHNNDICYDCLEHTGKVFKDKGVLLCPNCFHKRYSRTSKLSHRLRSNERTPTIHDLKRKWEHKNRF